MEPSESPARTVYGKNLCALDDFGSGVDPAAVADGADVVVSFNSRGAGALGAGRTYEEPGAGRRLSGGRSEPYRWGAVPADEGADVSWATAGTAAVRGR